VSIYSSRTAVHGHRIPPNTVAYGHTFLFYVFSDNNDFLTYLARLFLCSRIKSYVCLMQDVCYELAILLLIS